MKKIVILCLALIMVLGLCACGETSTEPKQEEVSPSKQEDTPAEKEEVVDTTPTIEVGQKLIKDKYEATIDYIKITDDVTPPHPGSYYSHYEAENGKVYVDLCVAYKNTDTSEVDADKIITGKLIYAGKYEYLGFSMIEEDNRSDFTYANITSIAPLNTEYVHYLFEVPEEVDTSGEEILLRVTIGEDEYKTLVRKSNGASTNTPEKQEGKDSGEVVKGETLTTKNASLSIDYAKITDDVVPPKPGNFYSHYEAENGKVYVDICFAYKNTSDKNVGADDVISATLKYAGKYDYKGFSMIEEDGRSDFTYSNITSLAPLSTEYVHYLFEIPEEVAKNDESVVVTFVVDGNTYTYTVR